MAGAAKRTTGVLVVLALLFIATIIILCLVPYSAPGGPYPQHGKSRPLAGDDVLTDTPPPATITPTTTTTTTAATTTTTTTTTTATTSTRAQPSTPSTTPSTTTHPPPPPPPPPTTTTTSSTVPPSSTTSSTAQPSTPSTTPPPLPPPTPTTSSTIPPPSTTTTTLSATTAPTTEPVETSTTFGTERTTATERTPERTDLTTIQVHSTTIRTTATPPSASTTESTTTTSTPPPPPLTTSPITATTTPPQPNTTTAIGTTTTATTAAPTTTTTDATAATTTTSSSSDSYNATSGSSVTQESSSLLPSTQTSSAPPSTTSEATSPSTEAPTITPATTPDPTPTSTDHTTAPSSTSSPAASSSSSSMTSPEPPATPCPTLAAPEPKNVCMSPACKTLAARMLDLMDHSGTNPCEDFYQYACGGVTDDLFLAPESRQVVTRRLMLDLIKGLSAEDPQLGVVKVFYDSCTSAEAESHNKTLWLAQVKTLFDAVGSAFGPGNTAGSTKPIEDSNVNITEILIGMMKIHFAPFFDLLLDVSEDGADEFVLMLTPPLLLSPFSEDVARAVCYGEHLNRTDEALHSASSSYDVNDDYDKYSECMGSGRGLQARLQQMRQAVEELGLLHHFNYTIHNQGAEGLLVDNLMDTEFLLGDLYNILPKKPDLRDGHLKKKYQKVTLSYLEQKFAFPNFKVQWVTLVEELLGHPVDPASTTVHIYFENELFAAFEEIDFKDPPQLQRILLLLLAERLYTDLVHPAQDGLGKPEYCLRTTRELLGDFISSLYVGGLPHIQERQEKIEEMVTASKEAAEKELNSQPNLQGGLADSWLKKLRDMSGEVASSDPSQYLPNDLNKTVLSDNFVENCLSLLVRYRTLMYQQYQRTSSSPSVLWSQFLMPFSFSGVTLYASNKFLIPYAAMEAPLFFWDVPEYINYAGVGHMIAHELMHGFDGTGSLYNGTHRHHLDGLRHFVNVSECLAYQYRLPHNLTAASGLTAKFTLGLLPLNEFLADSGAARLAWEAYEHSLLRQQGTRAPTVPATHGSQLPWLDLNPLQLYFLRVAQKHCAPTSDTHMLAIMEDEHLPSKLRVNLVLQNEPLFTEAFRCPAPSYQCPYVLG